MQEGQTVGTVFRTRRFQGKGVQLQDTASQNRLRSAIQIGTTGAVHHHTGETRHVCGQLLRSNSWCRVWLCRRKEQAGSREAAIDKVAAVLDGVQFLLVGADEVF